MHVKIFSQVPKAEVKSKKSNENNEKKSMNNLIEWFHLPKILSCKHAANAGHKMQIKKHLKKRVTSKIYGMPTSIPRDEIRNLSLKYTGIKKKKEKLMPS